MAAELGSFPAAEAGAPPPASDDGAGHEHGDVDEVEKARALICALNLVSRNLPLPPELFSSVFSIHRRGEDSDELAVCAIQFLFVSGFCSPLLISFFLVCFISNSLVFFAFYLNFVCISLLPRIQGHNCVLTF